MPKFTLEKQLGEGKGWERIPTNEDTLVDCYNAIKHASFPGAKIFRIRDENGQLLFETARKEPAKSWMKTKRKTR